MKFNYNKEQKFLELIRQGEFIFKPNGDIIRVKTNNIFKFNKAGYIVVKITGIGQIYAHRLIWMNYINNLIPPGLEINHKNAIRNDNRLENLEAVSHEENMRYAYRNKLSINERHKPTAQHVQYSQQILELRNTGMKRKDIAKKLNISLGVLDKSIRYLKEQKLLPEKTTFRSTSKCVILSNQVLELHKSGLSNIEISKKLHVSADTIDRSIQYLESINKL